MNVLTTDTLSFCMCVYEFLCVFIHGCVCVCVHVLVWRIEYLFPTQQSMDRC
jgi:hypothetical protein